MKLKLFLIGGTHSSTIRKIENLEHFWHTFLRRLPPASNLRSSCLWNVELGVGPARVAGMILTR